MIKALIHRRLEHHRRQRDLHKEQYVIHSRIVDEFVEIENKIRSDEKEAEE